MSNAPDAIHQGQRCQITHPFHPSYGKEIQVVTVKQTWGEDRAFYYQDDGRITSLPACWTSVYKPELFNVISDGRSVFRFTELLELARLVDEWMSEDQQ